MRVNARDPVRGYAVAVLAVAGAVLVRWLLDPLLADQLPLATLYAAVAFAAWYGGYRPALVVVILGYLPCLYLFIKPRETFGFVAASHRFGLPIYLVSCGIIIALFEAMRIAQRRSRQMRQADVEQKRAEASRLQSERRFRTLTNHAPVGIFETDTEGNCQFVNNRWCEMAGMSPEKAHGQGWVNALHPEDRDRVRREWYDAAKVGREFSSEYRFRTPEGKITWLSGDAVAVRNESGQITGYIGTVADITQRKLAEQERQVVTDAISAPVSRCSRDLRYLWVNKPYADWIGHPAEEIVGRPIAEILGAKAFAQLRPYFERVLAGKQVRYEETVDYRGLGPRWVNAVYTPTFDPAGAVDGWVAVVLDMEERRQTENRLRESEEKYRRIVETANEGVWTLDADARITFVNRRMSEMLGYEPDEMVGRRKWDFVPEEEQARVRQLFERRRAGISEQVDVCFRHRDGRPVWVIMATRPLTGVHGVFQGSLDMFTDVSERRRAEETVNSLLRISERLNSTLEVDVLLDILVQEAITLVGAESGLSGLRTAEGMVCKRYFQKGTTLPLEYCWPPMHGLPGWLLVYKVPYLTNDALTDTQIVHELCVQFGVWSALSMPIITAQGEVVGFFEVHNKKNGNGFTSSDLELLQAVSQAAAIAVQNALAYRATRQAQETLQEADRRKDEFLATLAHELRNPLAPVRNALELLRRADGDSSVIDQSRRMMERQIGQMVRLIDDLLDVSRISRGKIELRRERVELATVVRSAVETTRPLIDAAAHEFTVVLPSEPIYLDADPTRLTQVFSNLINNAAKYTERAGHIWLVAERNGGEVAISVRDTGIGISAEHLPRLFEMFSQATPALERSQGGLGVGLSLVRGLVELHGGTVEARSAGPGLGSEFIVRLPVVDVSAQRLSRVESETGGHADAGPKRRILVVDDNRDAADSLAMMLSVMGHDVQTAYDGVEAVQAAETFQPEVLFLDIGLPRMNGYEVARHIRKQTWGKSMILIALTGWGQEEDKRRALDAGCDRHLTKPMDPAALEKLLGLMTPMTPP